MSKSLRFMLVIFSVGLLTAGAFAADRMTSNPPNGWILEPIESDAPPGDRDLYMLSYTFDDPLDIYFDEIQISTFGCYCDAPPYSPLPADALIVGFGWSDLCLTVYNNDGPTEENWASDMYWGYPYWTGTEVQYVWILPFQGVNDYGQFGPVSLYFDLTGWPSLQTPPPNDIFCFATCSGWDDQTGLPAGSWTSGTMYVIIDSPTVSNETASLTAVKSLFR